MPKLWQWQDFLFCIKCKFSTPIQCFYDVLQATEWAPNEATRHSCQSKGKSEVLCSMSHNTSSQWPEMFAPSMRLTNSFSQVFKNRNLSWPTQLDCGNVSLQEDCQNYVRVLLISGERLFTCGTNAFTPVCITRQVGVTVDQLIRLNQVWATVIIRPQNE